MRTTFCWMVAAVLFASSTIPAGAQTRPRGRDLGIPFPGQTGPLNAITDVAGIAVGHVTLIQGEGKLVPGHGPVRIGVTAILPRPKGNWDPVFAATFNLNGNGDMTGINWIKESGFMEGPVLLTGTHSVGTVRDAAIKWQIDNGRQFVFTYPIVAETFDFLNDANGEHVKGSHAIQALDGGGDPLEFEGRGSIIVVVATDAPLLPHQLERLTRRVGMGLGRLGSWAGNGSGDLFLAFSTGNPNAARPDSLASLTMWPNDRIDPLFRATIDATEEAVVNAMLAAQTMTGADGIRAHALPGDRLVAALRKYNRMQ